MEAVMERECSALGGLFQTVITDMKGSYPVWEDFISKAGKLQAQLRTTVVALAAFLDAFQKVADLATGSRGGTRDIGSALTRMCMRHRSIEAKFRQFSMVFVDSLINPLQEQMEEWKRVANMMDKDHAKEYKRARQEIKKKSSDTLKLQKKAKKGRGDLQPQVDSALQGVTDKYASLQETERQAVRKALIEERARFCSFVSMLRPAIEEEVCMLGEITHLQSISDDLRSLTMDPHKLPPSSEQVRVCQTQRCCWAHTVHNRWSRSLCVHQQGGATREEFLIKWPVISDLKGSECSWSYQTPPSSPSTTSRKSSMCSSLNSVNSSDSRSSSSHSHSPTSHFRYRGSALPQQGSVRLPSVSSHDSGFTSQDTCQSKSPSPMPPDTNTQCSASSCPDESTPTLPDCNTNTEDKDWARPGPYDQPMVNTLRRIKERERVRESCESSSSRDEVHKTSPNSEHSKSRDEAHEELAVCLSRGLSLEIPRSRDSVQGSSGYSTQTNTPCCSEDAHVFDYDYLPVSGDHDVEHPDCDGTTSVPRNTEISQSYRRMLPAKRPTSTPGLPCSSVIPTPGIATIRRAPSSKPSLWRGSSGQGPIPIRTPVIPVKTPTVPEPPATTDSETPQSPTSSSTGNSSNASPSASQETPTSIGQSDALQEEDEEELDVQEDDVLLAIRRGVRLKKTMTNDRSAPLFE
ncbi:protein MTSS 1 isoform X2 [Pygocentrus nattereri]|uniref:protein MTSS 1 isoform X2 n=1 Tax=Pygocentrus nattereri TaxID=42514 RepID=UPI001891083B|nr:protein MTSS 1 isoform X2 [Pygocentrus nattereri]